MSTFSKLFSILNYIILNIRLDASPLFRIKEDDTLHLQDLDCEISPSSTVSNTQKIENILTNALLYLQYLKGKATGPITLSALLTSAKIAFKFILSFALIF
jgi:hypothetical protein